MSLRFLIAALAALFMFEQRASFAGIPLTITATGVDKVFDGTTDAMVTLSDNRLPGDIFTDNYTFATFSDSTVGSNKVVTVTGIFITGPDISKYTLLNTTATTTANIGIVPEPGSLWVLGVGAIGFMARRRL